MPPIVDGTTATLPYLTRNIAVPPGRCCRLTGRRAGEDHERDSGDNCKNGHGTSGMGVTTDAEWACGLPTNWGYSRPWAWGEYSILENSKLTLVAEQTNDVGDSEIRERGRYYLWYHRQRNAIC